MPLRGVSAISTPGGAFFDADADASLFEAVRTGLVGSGVVVTEIDTDINDPAFARAMVNTLHAAIRNS